MKSYRSHVLVVICAVAAVMGCADVIGLERARPYPSTGAGGGHGSEAHGPSTTQFVAAGDQCSSTNYRGAITVGWPASQRHQSGSTNFRLHDGLIEVMENTP